MSIKLKNQAGSIIFKAAAIKSVVGKAVSKSYGVKKMSSQSKIQDNLKTLLKQQDYGRGIELRDDDGNLTIDINIIAPDVNIPAIAKSIQKTVAFDLKADLGISPVEINIIVENVAMNN